jgi:hypothetical protein
VVNHTNTTHTEDSTMKLQPSILRGCAALTVAAAGIAASATIANAHGDEPHGEEPAELTGPQRKVIRDATRQFRDVDVALAAGYVPTEACAALPGVGGMGYHYVNPGLIGDARVDPTMPEILLYYRDDRGRLKLGGVEYFVADADQDLATDGDRPTLMGHAFDGPMPGHEPGMPVHYDLHAWVYLDNPSGDLAAWNPNLTCPTP